MCRFRPWPEYRRRPLAAPEESLIGLLVPGRMPGDVPGRVTRLRLPPRGSARGVETKTGNDHVGMPRVRVDRDPVPGSGVPPDHESGRIQRRGEKAAAVQREADRPGTVIAR